MVELVKEYLLNQYVIYKNPTDHPKKYVTRKWGIQPGGLEPLEKVVCNTLKEARDIVPKGLVKVDRDPQDDPCIYEVWI